MAEIILRANLSAAVFPLVSDWQGRTIIIPRFDQNFQKSAIFAGADEDRDVGIPQVFYGHDIMPTEQGFQSVSYTQEVEGLSLTPVNSFDALFTLRDTNENITLWSPANGTNYVYDSPTFTWSSVSPVANVTPATQVTATYLKGAQYVYYSGIGAYTYNTITKLFNSVTLTGLTPTAILGLTSSNNYLIAWDTDNVYWSSLLTPTDFVPSLSTGAGAITPSDTKGTIVACFAISGGFLIYTTANVVSATFTGNARSPWIFKEVANSGGIRSTEQVTYEANALQHWAYTTRGLQRLDKNQALIEEPWVSDFLGGSTYEDWDYSTNQPVQVQISAPLRVKLALTASRYLVISYGIESLTFALVLDVPMKRWGKLKIAHVDAFTYIPPNIYGAITYANLANADIPYFQLYGTSYRQLLTRTETAEVPKKSIGFLQANGRIVTVNFDLSAPCEAVLLLGKFQFERTSVVTLLQADAENISPNPAVPLPQVRVLSALEGKQFTSNLPARFSRVRGEQLQSYFRATAMNHSVAWIGTFNLVTAVLTFLKAGAR